MITKKALVGATGQKKPDSLKPGLKISISSKTNLL